MADESRTDISDVRDYRIVPFFKNDNSQITFECVFLILLLFLASAGLLAIHFGFIGLEHPSRCYIYSVIGGILGGWTFDVKWFYRVTAKGKDSQYRWRWESNKFYWRIFTPFISGIVAFALYLGALSKVIPVIHIAEQTGGSAFAFSYIVGYFSDMAIAKMYDIADSLFGGKNAVNDVRQ